MDQIQRKVLWQLCEVKSPVLSDAVQVIAAKDIPYVSTPNRYQTYHVYLPRTAETEILAGKAFESIHGPEQQTSRPRYHVHIHGGAWRDPDLTALSIETAVAQAFSSTNAPYPIKAVIGINYTLSPFPNHPNKPYDPEKGDHGDPGREARHPKHIHDVLTALNQLRTQGLDDDSYILTAHSCGACIAMSACLRSPDEWALSDVPSPPRPAALVGMNGLYHLPALVDGLGETHKHLRDDYISLIGQAYGTKPAVWESSSPALLEPDRITELISRGIAPQLVVIDQSSADQLVPMNQLEHLESCLRKVGNLRLLRGTRCVGRHAAPWEQGDIIWQLVQDVLKMSP